jgi:Tfp pilus assembly PilM family ATPase
VKGVFSGIDELRRWLNLYHHGEEVVSFESCALTGMAASMNAAAAEKKPLQVRFKPASSQSPIPPPMPIK